MTDSYNLILPYVVVASHVAFVILLLAIATKVPLALKVRDFFGKQAILLALILSLVAVASSLFYSEIIGYEPCILCWWQRVLTYPMVVLFAVALQKKHHAVFMYAIPLALISAVIAGYQSYVYMGGTSILPCTALGGACSKNYVMEFGYISIPSMSFTVAIYILALAWFKNVYDKNSHPR